MQQEQDKKVFYHYLSDLFHFDPIGMVVIFCLMVINSITVGIGILMIIPLLGLLGISSGLPSQEPSAGTLVNFIQNTGINFNLYSILAFYIGLICVNQFINHYQNIKRTRLSLLFSESFKIRLYKAISNANWLFITSSRSSDFTHLLSSDANRIQSGTFSGLKLFVGLLLLLVYVTLSFNLSIQLSLLAVVIGSVFLIAFRPLNKRALSLGVDLTKNNQTIYANISEFLSSLKLIKSHGLQEHHINAFEKSVAEQNNSRIKFTKQSSLANASFKIVSALTISVFVVFAIEVVQLPLAQLFVLIILLSRILPLFSDLQQNYQRMLHMLPAYTAVVSMIKECENSAEYYSIETDTEPVSLTKNIVVSNVCFSYQASGENLVFKNINLSIPANKMTAIVGRSGAGKSTLADLIIGLMSPNEGEILIDDKPLAGPLLKAWRKQIAYIPQETFLFHDTIRSNICWGKNYVKDEDLMYILISVGAKNFIDDLPSGLDTVVGDRGMRLSGGQCQRIALARALLRKPILLLLDEASNSLDHESESYIQDTISGLNGRLTIVVIAHRLSTIKGADQILVLENGKVSQTGNWKLMVKRAQTEWLDEIAVI